jgi:DNA adenine methylase
MNSPLRYIGAKHRLSSFLFSIMPPHNAYVDVFGGSAAMIFKKNPSISKQEVYNDIDSNLVTFFKVLRERPAELQRLCQLTPYSREEHKLCKATVNDPGLDELERARRVFVVFRQSFAGKHISGWGFSRGANTTAATFANRADALMECAERLRNVSLENDDFQGMINRYGSDSPKHKCAGNLLYCDLPYHPEMRNLACDNCYCTDDEVCYRCQIYRCEMAPVEHERFLDAIVKSPSMVMISGYHSEMYEAWLWKWKRYEKTVPVNCSKVVNQSRQTAVEVVWVNHAAEIAFRTQRIPV